MTKWTIPPPILSKDVSDDRRPFIASNEWKTEQIRLNGKATAMVEALFSKGSKGK